MTSSDQGAVELADYRAILWRHKLLVIACALLTLGAAYAFTAAQPREYVADTSVLVEPIVVDPFSQSAGRVDQLVDLDTEAQLVTSVPVAELARTALKTERSARELIRHVDVSVPADTQVLVISFTDDSPGDAQAGADGFANAYLSYRRTQSQNVATKRLARLEADVARLNAALQKVGGQLVAAPADSPDRAFLQSQQQALTNELTDVSGRVSALRALDADPGQIIRAAERPDSPSSPLVPVNLAVGLVAGLLLGVVLAVLRDRLDRRVRDAASVENGFGLPVLAEIPQARSGRGRGAKGRATGSAGVLVAPGSSAFEGYRSLRAALIQEARPGSAAVSLVGSASPGMRTTSASVNLAAALVRSSASVVLLRADFGGSTDAALGLDEGPGLSDVLLGDSTPGDALGELPALPQLQVIGLGRSSAAASELLASRQMVELVATLRRAVDHVVIEGPPVPLGADAAALAAHSDHVVLVVAAGTTTRPEVSDSISALTRARGRLLGVLLLVRPSSARPAAPAPGQPPARDRATSSTEG